MIRKITALLMFAVAVMNTLSLGVGEMASACASNDDVISVRASDGHSEQAQITIASAHQELDNCGSCHHEGSGNHQCHIGHCQSVVVPSGTSLLTPDAQLALATYVVSWLTTELSSLDRPPRA